MAFTSERATRASTTIDTPMRILRGIFSTSCPDATRTFPGAPARERCCGGGPPSPAAHSEAAAAGKQVVVPAPAADPATAADRRTALAVAASCRSATHTGTRHRRKTRRLCPLLRRRLKRRRLGRTAGRRSGTHGRLRCGRLARRRAARRLPLGSYGRARRFAWRLRPEFGRGGGGGSAYVGAAGGGVADGAGCWIEGALCCTAVPAAAGFAASATEHAPAPLPKYPRSSRTEWAVAAGQDPAAWEPQCTLQGADRLLEGETLHTQQMRRNALSITDNGGEYESRR